MVEINRSQSGNTRRESGLKNLMRDDKPVLAISGERVKDTRQLLVSLRRRRMHDFLHVSLSEADQEKLHVFEPIWITMSKDRKLGRGSASYIGISDMELAIRFSSAIIERIKDSSLVEILAKTISRFEHDQVRLRLLSIAAVQDINTLDKIVAVFSKSNSVKLINSFGDQDIAVKMSGEVEAMLYHSSSTGNARKIVDYLAGRMGEQELDQVES
ncbi:MAG: hypothetical protein KGH67_03135, partial [Candidatus Micrarchaeota archaeon]|nr:hypothetical protein [Candidatus Micrarchaeota archaeon]